MKILLAGINSKFIHSNIAIRYIKKYTEKKLNINIDIYEFTVNQNLDFILSELLKYTPDIIGFSCYIWNIDYIKKLSTELKKLLPSLIIILGGPEISYAAPDSIKAADYIISGEGELAFSSLISSLTKNKRPTEKRIYGKPVDMNELPFIYDNLTDFENRIIYYETMRGCPFSCGFCLSSVENGVRFKSLDKVFSELLYFLENNVMQVKLVDRTFNCNKKHCLAIIEFLKSNDNGITNFHFEIAAVLIDDDFINAVSDARVGLFQFEIGVQSTNLDTLDAINRKSDYAHLSSCVKRLLKPQNIHIHLDLIAGLPFEAWEGFKASFNDVYTLSPHMLQMGFLKLLKGSYLHQNADKYGIIYRDYPPFEVLKTNWLSHKEMIILKQIEEMVEIFYNSNRFIRSLNLLLSNFKSPFDMFFDLAVFYFNNKLHYTLHSKNDFYEILYNFAPDNCKGNLLYTLKIDLYAHEKAKKLPHIFQKQENNYGRIKDLLLSKGFVERYLPEYLEEGVNQIIKEIHIEFFENEFIVFNYRRRDLNKNADVYIINI